MEFPFFGYFVNDGPRVSFAPCSNCGRDSPSKYHKIPCSDIDNSMQCVNGLTLSILQKLAAHATSLAKQGYRIKLNILIGNLLITAKGALLMYDSQPGQSLRLK